MIKGLKSEKEHLNLSLEESQKMKDQYKKKGDEMLKKYNGCFDELSLILQDKVGIDQIKKDRDERINALRDEFDYLNTKHDDLMKNYS